MKKLLITIPIFMFMLVGLFFGNIAENQLSASTGDTIVYDGTTYRPVKVGDDAFGKKILFRMSLLSGIDLPTGIVSWVGPEKQHTFVFFCCGCTEGESILLNYKGESEKSPNIIGSVQVADCNYVLSNTASYDYPFVNELPDMTDFVSTPFTYEDDAPYICEVVNYTVPELGITVPTFVFIEVVEGDKTPVINGGEVAYLVNIDTPKTVEEIKSTLTAIDNEDGNISSSIVVESDGYTANKNKIGTYPVVYSVTDSAGNKATITVQVAVRDVTAPVISGNTTYSAKISTLTPLTTLKALLSVTDNVDKNLTLTLVSDGYSANYNKVGTYNVVYSASDSAGNTSSYTIKVTTKDDVAPTFSGPTAITKNQSTMLTIADIKGRLSANDVVDGNITSRITILEDNYTGSGNKAGQYSIKFEVTDLSNNKATHTITVTIIDDIPPVFFVDGYYIQVSQLETLSREQIIELLTATGQISSFSSKTIRFVTNTYEGNEDQVGIYPVVMNVKYVDGNEDEIAVAVQVLEDETTDDTIKVVEGDKFTWETVKEFFLQVHYELPMWSWCLIGFGGLVLILIILSSIFRPTRRRRY